MVCAEAGSGRKGCTLKKVPALVATAVSAVLVTSMGVQTTSASVATAADDSSGAGVVRPGVVRPGVVRLAGHDSGADDGAFSEVNAPKGDPAKGKGKGKGGRYRVPTGAYFNNPRGGWNARLQIERQVLHAIKDTRKGAIIRIALYSFDRVPVAKGLVAAKRRGVHIQLLLNDHQDTKAMKMLRGNLGTNVKKKSFIYKCHSGCRTDGRKRLLHTKFYTFSKTGRSKWALFFGSANLTMNAARHQWNDLYLTAGDKELFKQYVALFEDMKKDYENQQPRCRRSAASRPTVSPATTRSTRAPPSPSRDCSGRRTTRSSRSSTGSSASPPADGQRVRTRLAVNMHTIRGQRGNYLADAYRRKFAEGCQARFSFGLVGAKTKGHLGAKTPRGRLPLRSTGFDYHPDTTTSRRTTRTRSSTSPWTTTRT